MIRREWAMPDHNTFSIKPIAEWIEQTTNDLVPGVVIDPFARGSRIATITNDLNPDFDTDFNMDALDFLKSFDDDSVDQVLFDPPYSPRQLKECYNDIGQTLHDTKSSVWSNWKKEIARITKPGGYVLSFGWNTVGIGKTRGFEIRDILLVCHGGMHNDTICVREVKL
jgi:hypothetical protein